jgi:hypothetical protein
METLARLEDDSRAQVGNEVGNKANKNRKYQLLQ